MRPLKSAVLGSVATIAVVSGWSGAASQQSSFDFEPSAICMARELTSGNNLSIVLPSGFEGAMEGKGFQVVTCAEAFRASHQVSAYRDTICDLAANPSELVQEEQEQRFGERPAVLCAMAEAVLGPSVRREIRNRF